MKIIAHRGSTQDYPENTLPALQKAIELGFDGVECDVRRCGSGELVLFHDADLKRLASRDGLISQTALSELKRLRFGGSYQIATLQEAVDQILPQTWINFELKEAGCLGELTQMIPRHLKTQVLVTSKNTVALSDAETGLKLGVIHPLGVIALRRARGLGVSSIVTRRWFINRAVWSQAAQAKLDAYAYSTQTVQRLPSRRPGLTGLIIDFLPPGS